MLRTTLAATQPLGVGNPVTAAISGRGPSPTPAGRLQILCAYTLLALVAVCLALVCEWLILAFVFWRKKQKIVIF